MKDKFAIGQTVTKQSLVARLAPHGEYKLGLPIVQAVLERLPRSKGQQQKYTLKAGLPDPVAVETELKSRYTSTLGGVLEQAQADAEGLKDELQEWYDNLPEGLQGSDKGSQLEDAVNQFDSASWPDEPDAPELRDLPVFYLPDLEPDSRAARGADITGALSVAKDTLDKYLEALTPGGDGGNAETKDEGERLSSEIQEVIDALVDVEYPGMY